MRGGVRKNGEGDAREKRGSSSEGETRSFFCHCWTRSEVFCGLGSVLMIKESLNVCPKSPRSSSEQCSRTKPNTGNKSIRSRSFSVFTAASITRHIQCCSEGDSRATVSLCLRMNVRK